TEGERGGGAVSAMEGQSREAIDSGNKVHVAGVMIAEWTLLCAAIVPNFHLPMHSYEVKNMYLMTLLNLSARFCGLRARQMMFQDVKQKVHKMVKVRVAFANRKTSDCSESICEKSWFRCGLVDQRRSFNGEVAASTFSTAVATEHVRSSRDETQGEHESLSYFIIAMCLCDWISLCLTWVIVLGKKQSYEGS
ncbi:hypothetical protein Tco_0861973, partial [Tanacetum coccineum]